MNFLCSIGEVFVLGNKELCCAIVDGRNLFLRGS